MSIISLASGRRTRVGAVKPDTNNPWPNLQPPVVHGWLLELETTSASAVAR